MRIKRFLCSLVLFLLSITVLPFSAKAAYTSGVWEYTLYEGYATISNYNGTSSYVTVPSYLGGYKVIGIGNSAFENCYNITSVSLPSTLESIGSYAFNNCTSLTGITFPKNLKSVGKHAFRNCRSLSSITVNSTDLYDFYYYKYDSDDTFYNAGKDTANGITVTFSEGVTRIPAYMFNSRTDNYARIKKVNISSSVDYIGSYAFGNCYDLSTVSIPSASALESIGNGAFENCNALTSISLPKKLESIGSYVFNNCISLPSITLPQNLKSVDKHAFRNCKSLSSITVNSTDLYDFYYYKYDSDDTFYNAGKDTANGITVTFGEGVTRIPAYMFNSRTDNYARVKKVNISSSVDYIGSYAFGNCYDLSTVSIPSASALESIGNGAFENCNALTSISLPKKLESIGSYVFNNCISLPSITLPQNLKSVGKLAFGNCRSLSNITVNSTDLYDFYYYEYDSDDTFYNAGKDAANGITVTFSEGVTKIPAYMFNNRTDNYARVKKVNISSTVTLIRPYAFGCCHDLTTVSIPSESALEGVGYNAFEHCTSLRKIKFGQNLEFIGEKAFYGCENLRDIRFSGNAPSFYSNAFYDVPATVYYPGNDNTWKTTSVLQNYGGDLTWTPYNSAKITTQPKTTYTKSGATAKTTVKATGDGLKYQWYIKNSGATKYSKSSITKSTYSCTMNSKTKDRLVYCVVTDQYGNSVKSNTVRLRMAATITTQPKTTYTQSGETAKVTLKADGDGLKYQWYIKNSGATKYSKSSITSATYTCTMSSKTKDRLIYCVVTDQYGNSVKSSTVRLRMAATITKEPVSVTVDKGDTAKVTVKATGDGLTYKWYYKNPGESKYTYTSSFKGNSYSVTMSASRDGRKVYCIVTDKYGNEVRSKTVSLNMD